MTVDDGLWVVRLPPWAWLFPIAGALLPQFVNASDLADLSEIKSAAESIIAAIVAVTAAQVIRMIQGKSK